MRDVVIDTNNWQGMCAGWLVAWGLATGCYAYGGRAIQMTPAELLVEARDACQRRDVEAYRTLLERLIRTHPEASEAEWARKQLDKPEVCNYPDSE